MRIELTRCVVRSWESRDATFPHPYTQEDAERFIGVCRRQDPETVFAIEVEGEAVGSIGFRLGEDVERTSAEVEYWLGKKFWGCGVTSEALEAIRDYAIARFSLTRVYALPFEWNTASFRVLEKAGFQLEGRLRRSAIKDGRVVDQMMYGYVAPGA